MQAGDTGARSRGRRGHARRRGSLTAAINVTPLVDVVLVLLIIFMAVGGGASEGSLRAYVSRPANAATAAARRPRTNAQAPIIVDVGPDGQPSINGEAVPAGNFGARLTALLPDAAKPGLSPAARAVYFRINDRANYGRAVGFMDVARGAGAAVAIMPTPPDRP